MPAAVSFPMKTVLQFTAGIQLPETVFRIEIITGPIIITGLDQQMQVRILGNRLAEGLPRMIILVIPGMQGPEHIIFQIGLIMQVFPEININSGRKRMEPGSQLGIIIRDVSGILLIDTPVAGIQSSYGKPFIPQELFAAKISRDDQVELLDR